MNKDQNAVAFFVCKAADFTKYNGFAGASGHDQQDLRVLGKRASDLGNGQFLIRAQCHRGLHDLRRGYMLQ